MASLSVQKRRREGVPAFAILNIDPFGIEAIRERLCSKFTAVSRIVQDSTAAGIISTKNPEEFNRGLRDQICGSDQYAWERQAHISYRSAKPENVATVARGFEKAAYGRVQAYVRYCEHRGELTFTDQDPNGDQFLSSLRQAMALR